MRNTPTSRRSKLRLKPLVLALALPLPGLACAQLVGNAARPAALDPPWGFSVAPQLVEHADVPGAPPAAFALGQSLAGAMNRDVTIEGAGELRRGANVIKGDKLHYDQDSDTVDAYGNVRLFDHGNAFFGPRAQYRLDSSEGYLLSPTYRLGGTGGRGAAQRIDIIDDERSRFTKGNYTGCSCEDPSWYIRASRFDIDQGSNMGTARDGVLFFQHVPIFASPYLTFPLTDDRQSGLLPPTFTINSSSGADVTIPYYFNIAPNRDATLNTRILQRRGVQFSTDVRYLAPSYNGSFTGEWMPTDHEAKLDNRYAVYLKHNQALGGGVNFYVNYNRVSDRAYPSDLANSSNVLFTGTQLLFQQEVGLSYAKGPWSVLARVQRWQSLETDDTNSPYQRVPELSVKYQRYDVGGFDFGAEANYTHFESLSDALVNGSRVFLNPYVSYPVIGPGYFVVPKVQAHLAAYQLSNTTQSERDPSVAIPTFSLDTGLIFQRSVSIFGADYIQTLEPRVFYVYTPYVDQSAIPIFDSARYDFGLAEIFTENTYVGNDRVADGNRMTAGLTTRFINPATGDERARFLVAQQYYFRSQRTTLPVTDADPQPAVGRSDVIFGASLKIANDFATQNAVQYNQDNGQLVRSNFGFAWSPEDRKVINLAYRYTRTNTTLDQNSIKQIVVSAQWPITRTLYGVGRLNYAFDSGRVVDALLGMQYDQPCWTFGVALQRYANGLQTDGTPATGTRFLAQLELKGFSHIDNGLVAAFQASVPGYVPPPPPPPPLSRFSNYE